MKAAEDVDLTDPALDTIPPLRPGGGLLASFRAAIAGVLRTVATQRNMKIHLVAGFMVMIVGMTLPLDLSTRVALLFAVSIVFFAEILNTALEAVIDLFVKDFHRLAMLAKDAAAGGVLVFAVTTVFVLAEVLRMQWHVVVDNLEAVQRAVAFGVPLVGLELLGLFVVRRAPLQVARFVAALALFAPLVVTAIDKLFAVVGLLLLVVGFSARFWFTPRED